MTRSGSDHAIYMGVHSTHSRLTPVSILDNSLCLYYACYTEKAPNAWNRRGTPNLKTGNTYYQPKRPSTGTTHRPSTRHYEKGGPGVKTHNTNQHSSRARLLHSNQPPSSPTPNRVTTTSSQPTQPAVKHRRAEPHHNTEHPSPQWGHTAIGNTFSEDLPFVFSQQRTTYVKCCQC